ncbi:MAG: right-handed parallel beta-helix repeat-containing protein [Deltaproteobacteria bacterium]|nr:right-handed parallel beta-helix repeat-containing protein [Deltaproteobacteria bacterium]
MRYLPAFWFALALTACRYPDAEVAWDIDTDGDGFAYADDCDDEDPDVHPGASETCNDKDDDCDGTVDEDPIDPLTFYEDGDADGYGDPDGDTVEGCTAPVGYAADSTDCADDDASRNPGETEIPDDEIDQDCNGTDTVTCYVDDDQDGFGTDVGTTVLADDGSCDTSEKESENDFDCDDTNADIYLGAPEIPGDGIDQNCDTADTPACYLDTDADSFGDPLNLVVDAACDSDGRTTDNTDCDDNDGTVYPDADELCDGQLNDCDGAMLPAEADHDGDHYVECDIDENGWDGAAGVVGGEDCDDTDATIYPMAPQLCDGLHNDCLKAGWPKVPATETDDDDDQYVDCTLDVAIGDWGHTENPVVLGGGDCDDDEITVYPDAPELCDGLHNDCSDLGWTAVPPADEIDDDDDTYVECEFDVLVANWGYDETPEVAGDQDCNDGYDLAYPGATELCDGIDNDCDQVLDDDGTVSFKTLAGAWSDITDTVTGTVQPDVELATDGTVWFCKGTYDAIWDITASDASLIGRYGDGETTLTGSENETVIWVTEDGVDLSVQGLRIRHGDGGVAGGGLYITGASDVTVTECILAANHADYGGAAYLENDGGSLTIDKSTVFDNAAEESGAGVYLDLGTLTVTSSTFSGNDARGESDEGGGAIGVYAGTVTIEDSTLTDNDAGNNDGGAILVRDEPGPDPGAPVITLTRTEISANFAWDWGGGIACHRDCDITATDCDIFGNTAYEGGGILLWAGSFTCEGQVGETYGVYDNVAINSGSYVGGGIDLWASGAEVTSDHCNWGTGDDDNDPSDVAGDDYSDTSKGADASFTCTFDTACTN